MKPPSPRALGRYGKIALYILGGFVAVSFVGGMLAAMFE